MISDCETIAMVNAHTGEASPYMGEHIFDVISEQRINDNDILGVEEYLRKYCADEDVERGIYLSRRQTQHDTLRHAGLNRPARAGKY